MSGEARLIGAHVAATREMEEADPGYFDRKWATACEDMRRLCAEDGRALVYPSIRLREGIGHGAFYRHIRAIAVRSGPVRWSDHGYH